MLFKVSKLMLALLQTIQPNSIFIPYDVFHVKISFKGFRQLGKIGGGGGVWMETNCCQKEQIVNIMIHVFIEYCERR